jgi:hypothetical protein
LDFRPTEPKQSRGLGILKAANICSEAVAQEIAKQSVKCQEKNPDLRLFRVTLRLIAALQLRGNQTNYFWINNQLVIFLRAALRWQTGHRPEDGQTPS